MQPLTHKTLLSAVGVIVQEAMPFNTMCGVCKGDMSVHNMPEGGTWVCCSDCGFAGSSLAYVAHVKGEQRHHVSRVLRGMGIAENEITALLAYEAESRYYALLDLWGVARERMAPGRIGATGIYLVQTHALYTGMRGIQPWFGLLYGNDIRDLHEAHPKCFGVAGAGSHKSFLTVPYYDIPGRICGFGLFHSGGTAQLVMRYDGQRYTPGGGLACLPSVAGTRGTVYAVDDLHLALMLHGSHYATYGEYPALVAYEAGLPATCTWESITAGRVIFSGTGSLVDRIREAKRHVAGHVASAPVLTPCTRGQQLAAQLVPYTAGTYFPLADKNSKPWATAARVFLLNNPATLDERIRELGLSGASLQRVLDGCTDAERRALCATGPGVREATVNGTLVRARDTGYSVVGPRGERAVSDVVISVKQLLTTRETRATWVVGELVRGVERVPFCVPTALFKSPSQARTWLAGRFLAAGLRAPSVERAWLPSFLDMALAFAAPTTAEVSATLGWDADTARVVLPAVRISGAGIEHTTTPVLAVTNHVGPVPGQEWGSVAISDAVLSEFVASEHPEAVTAAAYCVCSVLNIVAVVRGRDACGLALGINGDYHGTMASVGAGFGWDIVRDAADAAAFVSGRKRHTPVIRGLPVVCLPRISKVSEYIAAGSPAFPCVVGCAPFPADCAALFPGWMRLQLPVTVPTSKHGAARNGLWPAAAAELASRAISVLLAAADAPGTLFGDVTAALLTVSDRHGSRAAVLAALGRLRCSEVDAATWFSRYMVLLEESIAVGRITTSSLLRAGRVVRIDVAGLQRAFSALGARHPDLEYVRTMAEAAGLLPVVGEGWIDVKATAVDALVA